MNQTLKAWLTFGFFCVYRNSPDFFDMEVL